jgi:hypothetical protein
MNRLLRVAGAVVVALATSSSAFGYRYYYSYPLGNGETGYSKWGDPRAGTASGVLTWSLMPEGTPIDPAAPGGLAGTSNLASVFNQVGGQAAAVAMIQSSLNAWAAVANVRFQYLGIDDGTPFGAPAAPGQAVGQIRFGAFLFDGGAASAFGPGGVTTLGGDILFNTHPEISYYVAPGAEGELFDRFPPGGGLSRNDFAGLVTHELGHALGLDHSDVPTGCMCGYVSAEFDGAECAYFDPDGDGRVPINRLPDADDAAGMQFLYGPAENADFNGDERVDGGDFLAWQRGVGMTGNATRADGDANGNHAVDGEDLAVWRGQFASAAAVANVVPEPAAALETIAVATLAVCRRLRRGRTLIETHASRRSMVAGTRTAWRSGSWR